jgi:hypothetical protein
MLLSARPLNSIQLLTATIHTTHSEAADTRVGAPAAHAATLINFKVVHLSSTASGGGVAEMLRSLIPMYT